MHTTGHLIHIICEVSAYILGYRYYNWLRRQQGDLISDTNRMWIFLGAAVGALIGSHVLGVLEKPLDFVPDVLYFYGQKTIAGGLIGGLIGVETTKKWIGVQTSSGDLMTYPLILGMVIGRVGCHFAGVEDGTYGIETNLPWGMDSGDGFIRHPVNLYEIIFLLCLAWGISWAEKRFGFPNGRRFQVFMVAYLAYRIAVECIKPAYFWPNLHLSSIQIASMLSIGYYALKWLRK
jgi:phosphatidylglycerol---prolipoprotein diacylglyceryl transferase